MLEASSGRATGTDEDQSFPSKRFHQGHLFVQRQLGFVELVVLLRLEQLFALLSRHQRATKADLKTAKSAVRSDTKTSLRKCCSHLCCVIGFGLDKGLAFLLQLTAGDDLGGSVFGVLLSQPGLPPVGIVLIYHRQYVAILY